VLARKNRGCVQSVHWCPRLACLNDTKAFASLTAKEWLILDLVFLPRRLRTRQIPAPAST
jgi:hypothetical protein